MADISYSTLSDATTAIDGTGNFDKLMKVVTLHVEAQFTAGRITGTDYATVYLGALQSTLAQAVTFTLNMNKANEEASLLEKKVLTEIQQATLLVKQQNKADAEVALLGQKEITEYAQTGTTSAASLPVGGSIAGKQITLFTQQAKGFKWNADAKYFKTVMDAYAINVSVSKEDDTDTAILQGSSAITGGIAKVIDDMVPSDI